MKRLSLSLLLCAALFSVGCQSILDSASPSNETSGGTNTQPTPQVNYETPLRLGDRYYVGSALTQLFIPDSVASGSETTERVALLTVINLHITSQVEELGGAQDLFTSFSMVTEASERQSRASFAAPNTSLRGAFVMRALYELLRSRTNELSMRSIIGQTRGLTYDQVNLTTLTAPTSTEFSELLNIVYPDVVPSETTLNYLATLRDEVIATSSLPSPAAKNLEAWRFVVLAIMSSMTWQML